MRKTILVLLLLAFSLSSMHAQQPEAWPVVKNCLTPTPSPDNWTFDGTLLMQGRYGIHSYKAAWETPRVQIWMDEQALRGGALSPDGQWYAYPYGEFFVTETFNPVSQVKEIHIRSTRDDREYRIPIFFQGFGGTYGQIHWLDNNALIFPDMVDGIQVIEFFADKASISSYELSINDTTDFYPSPDWQRAIVGDRWYEEDWLLLDIARDQFNEISKIESIGAWMNVEWKRDSSSFAASISYGSEVRIDIFNRNGSRTATPYREETGRGLPTVSWSPDGRYLAFVSGASVLGRLHLYIADMLTSTVIDTCQYVEKSPLWSPQVNQLVFLGDQGDQRPIQILDLEKNTLFTVGWHYLNYRSYRTDEFSGLIGWDVP